LHCCHEKVLAPPAVDIQKEFWFYPANQLNQKKNLNLLTELLSIPIASKGLCFRQRPSAPLMITGSVKKNMSFCVH